MFSVFLYLAMDNDLGGLDGGIFCNFINAGFCGHPLNMSGGSGWSNYPNAHLGVWIKYDLSPSWQLRVAAFNVDSESNGNSSRAWHLEPKHITGTVVPVELVYKNQGELPGEYKLGYYYDSSNVKRIGSDKEDAGRGGHYLRIGQTVWNSQASPGRSLHVFGQYSASRYGTGVVLYKPFEGRPRDTVSLGYGRAVPNPRSRDVLEDSALANGDAFSDLDSAEQLIELS